MAVILVTGSEGQLGKELQELAKTSSHQFIFTDVNDLNIASDEAVRLFNDKVKFDFCINTAAYTAVDLAENEPEKAFQVNIKGVENLAALCLSQHAWLLHISTDFVFDGNNSRPYIEIDATSPLSIYGKTKRDGEVAALRKNPNTIIVRTSWLYSPYGKNFVKTMLFLADNKPAVSVVADQIGTPTYAKDLAEALLKIIDRLYMDKNAAATLAGVYHFSNEGVASWYDFAYNIFELKNKNIPLKPIKTHEFPTPAKRPSYSVLDKSKIKNIFGIEIRHWRNALEHCLKQIA